MRRIHHVGIVVNRLTEAYRFYRDVLGLPLLREAEIADQGVRAALLAAGESEVELLEPLGASTPVGRFLAKRGEGLHHLCFRVVDEAAVDRAARELVAAGVEATPPRRCPEYDADYYATFFTDGDGIRLEVTNFRERRRRRMYDWDAEGVLSG